MKSQVVLGGGDGPALIIFGVDEDSKFDSEEILKYRWSKVDKVTNLILVEFEVTILPLTQSSFHFHPGCRPGRSPLTSSSLLRHDNL